MQVSERFVCPGCGARVLEEILADVTQCSVILAVEAGELDYGTYSTDGGSVERYQCAECGWPVPAETPEELEAWLLTLPLQPPLPVLGAD